MNRQENVVDLVKAAFIVLIVKVMASTSTIMPWNTFVDNLCITFAICVMLAKICRFTMTLKKLLTLGAAALVVLYTCVSMGQYDLLVTMVAIFLVIDEDLEEYLNVLLHIQVAILIIHIAASGVLSLSGSAIRFWFTSNGRLRFSGGFSHSNVLSCYVLSCMLLFSWKHFRHITSTQFVWMAFIMGLTYIASKSRTGLLLNLFLLLLIYLTQNENHLLQRAINPILLLLFTGLAATFFWAQKQYAAGNRIALLLDDLLTGRVKYAAYAFLRSGTTWLPRYLDYVASGSVTWSEEWRLNTFTFDNLYSFIFAQMGMIWLIIIPVLLVVVCKKFDFRNKVFILFWLLFSIVETHGLNCFKFFPLLLLSTLISEKGAEDHPTRND